MQTYYENVILFGDTNTVSVIFLLIGRTFGIEKRYRTFMNENNVIKSWDMISRSIAGVFIILVLAVYPLSIRHFYFDILKAKYLYYYVGVIAITTIMLITALFFVCKDYRINGSENVKAFFRIVNIKRMKAVDWAMFSFVLMYAISTFQSDYLYESFWGNEGRLCGLFLILLYGASYIIIVGCLRFKRVYLDAFLLAGIMAGVIGILQYFKFNPFGMKTGLSPSDQWIFTSTIGNVNTYTSYLSLLLGVGVILFTQEKNHLRKIFYLLSVIVTMSSLVAGISDNAYITFIVLLGLLPLYLFVDLNGVKQYTLILSILLTILLVFGWIDNTIPQHVIKIEGLFEVIIQFHGLLYISIAMWVLTLTFFIIERKRGGVYNKSKRNIGRWIWLGVLILLAFVLLAILYDVNILGNVQRYGILENYLLFNDNWGTHRGYIWRITFESYQKFPLHHKIFGYGPETFGIVAVREYMTESVRLYNERFDNAHNEYVHYFFTIGIAGLTAYLALLITSLKEMIHSATKKPVVMGIAFSLVCYWVQAAVNVSTPIVSPIMFTLLMTGIAACRTQENPEAEIK